MTNDPSPPRRSAHATRRLFSLAGVVPLGLFVVVHLLANGAALSGDVAYARIARPLAFPLAVLVVYLPLAIHAVYGLLLVMRREHFGEPQPNRYLWIVQRLSSVVVLGFVAYHVFATRFFRFRTGIDASAIYTRLTEHLSSTTSGLPLVAGLYVIGVAATVFHLTYGIWTFARPKRNRTTVLWGAAGVLLFVIGTSTVICVATGGRLLPSASPSPKTTSCPP